jgi:lysophospholipase L1-like esterase
MEGGSDALPRWVRLRSASRRSGLGLPTTRRGTQMKRPGALAVVSGVIALIASCSSGSVDGSGGGTSTAVTSSPSSWSVTRLVVLGDSIALGETCSGCTTYPQQVAAAMAKALDVDVETENLSVAGAEVADLLKLVRDNSTVRDSIAGADAILMTIGWNDLAFGRLDDPCGVAPHFPKVAWGSIDHACIDAATADYRRDLDSVLTEIDTLRSTRPTMLRITTVYNAVIGDKVDPTWNSPAAIEPSTYAVEQMGEAQCEIVEEHGGACADTYHALNGKDGTNSAQPFLNPADATHLAQPGEDAFAGALIALGFSPLQS